MKKEIEFNLRKKRRELFEKELVGRPNGGRIYRKIIAQDKQFLKEVLDELEKKCWIDLTGDRLLDWEDVEKIIRVLSNREIVKGLKSALEDFKKGRYTISIMGDKLKQKVWK